MIRFAEPANDRPGDPGYEECLAAFEARVGRGDKVEPGDWMPADYRKQLIRLIQSPTTSTPRPSIRPNGGT